VVAEQLKRQWKGCDSSAEYCQWAADRIEMVEDWPVEKWLRYDEQNTERRKSIAAKRTAPNDPQESLMIVVDA
jgi:site-specific DNA-methyltransferase (adenine-specific)